MKIIKLGPLLFAALLLISGCNHKSSANDSTPDSETTVTSAATETTEPKPAEPETVRKPEKLKAEYIEYDGEFLTYGIDGEEYSVRMSPELLGTGMNARLNDLILNNRFGEAVAVYISLNDDGSEIEKFDAVNANVKLITDSIFSGGLAFQSDEDRTVRAKRIEGSVYELGNSFGSVTVDINDLDNFMKGNYPDEFDNCHFQAYQFKSGNAILTSLTFFDRTEETEAGTMYVDSGYTNAEKYSFYGMVSVLNGDRASVVLNDGITVCDVPTWYRDGELSEGMQVMITLDAKAALYGSGEEYSSDFAVFHTSPAEYDPKQLGFDNLAYSRYGKDNSDSSVIFTEK